MKKQKINPGKMIRETIIILMLSTIIGMFINAYSGGIPLYASNIKPVDLYKAFELFKSGDAVFVDARSYKDYKAGHIRNAISIPYKDLNDNPYLLIDKIEIIPTDAYVVVYCSGLQCEDSHSLAKELAELKFNVYIFYGGWDKWKAAQYPVETSR